MRRRHLRITGRNRGVAALAITALLLLVSCSGAEQREPKPPHLFLIVIDTLRADHLSLNGYARKTSPAIDAFAQGASHFPQAITVIPKTCPSMASVFSGMHPIEQGVRSNLDSVPASAPWLPEILHEAGYRTIALVSNPVLQRRRGFGRGFDIFRRLPSASGARDIDRAFEKLSKAGFSEPTFVWLHYIDPHGPYTPPPAFTRPFEDDELSHDETRVPIRYEPIPGYRSSKILGAVPNYQRRGDETRVAAYVRNYDGEIRYVDEAISKLLGLLDDRGLLDGSVIVLTADHGESLGEHNYFFEHGWYAYDASLRIPLLIHAPGQTKGVVRNEYVSNLDLFPTLLGFAGIENRWGGLGRDLRTSLPLDQSVVVENSGHYPEQFLGLRTRDRKYLMELTSKRESLFYLDLDPGEISNRIETDPAAADRARQSMAKLLGRMRR